MREALLSIWGHDLSGLDCLDLFTGTAAVSVELIGCGARRVVTIEADPAVAREVREALRRLEISGIDLREGRLPGGLARCLHPGESFDRVFADPPYDFVGYDELLRMVAPWLAPTGELVLEMAARSEVPQVAEFETRATRRYGETLLVRYGPAH